MSNSVIPWTAACQAFLSVTISWSLLKFMSTESVMPSNHLILCCPLFLPLIFPSLRVFSNESALHIRRLQHQSFLHCRPDLFPFGLLIYLFWGCIGSFLLLLRFFPLAVASRGYSLLQGMVLGYSGSVVVVQRAQLPTGM